MLGVSSLVTSKLLCYPETGRLSTLPPLKSYARNLIRRDAETQRPRSTEAVSQGIKHNSYENILHNGGQIFMEIPASLIF